ncbi:MAG: hypothetical protein HYX57_09440 [Chloroflexi bacterium]|nr:hypothetical protein [Chloroflexota bacterium]
MTVPEDLPEPFRAESAQIATEMAEIELLVAQARTEFARHEARRAAAAEKLAALGSSSSAREVLDLANQAVTLTRRAALMDAQVEILDGKRKSLVRLQQAIDDHGRLIAGEGEGPEHRAGDATRARGDVGAPDAPGGRKGRGPGTKAAGAAAGSGSADDDDGLAVPPAVSRLVLSAQEDLRREIARAMHDGPAQSLTNIVLQAEIVERLVARDPSAAESELRQLVAMVQQTLEATKAFIFDVRPMVLDDLGLVPTLRRAARERGRRAGIAVEFESMGVDLRLPVDLESGLFRILDEGLGAYLEAKPERVSLRLDWTDVLAVELAAARTPPAAIISSLPAEDGDMPAALAAMVEQRREAEVVAAETARRNAVVQLPKRTWRDLAGRAASLGIGAELLDEGGRIRLVLPLARLSDAASEEAGPEADGGAGATAG